MKLTEISFRIMDPPTPEGVLAYVHLVLDGQLAIKDLRLVSRRNKTPLLCMPGRAKTVKCEGCQTKNPANHFACHKCGMQLPKLKEDIFVDIAHPITKEFREYLETEVLQEYTKQKTTDVTK